ncbi:MAG: hypothetical protein ACYCVY_09145 [Acidiferrobacteraceae bacterium]
MAQIDTETLKQLAGKYVWWKTPNEAIAMPERIIAQVMNLGDYADVRTLAEQVGDTQLRDVLAHAEAAASSTNGHGPTGTTVLGWPNSGRFRPYQHDNSDDPQDHPLHGDPAARANPVMARIASGN